nr:hypothetical protein [Tanacetum cinerariifolium]
EEEEDPKEEEEDPKEDPEEDDDDDMEMDDEAKVIDPYMDDGLNNLPPLNSEDKETPPTSPVIPDADGKMEKLMLERRMKKKFKEQDRHFVGVVIKLFIHDMDMSWYKNSCGLLCVVTELCRLERAQEETHLLYFMKCSPITFRGNEGVVGLIRWIKKTKMVFTVSKCIESNKVVFAAVTFQDRALTWWNSQVATLGIEVVTRKTWAEMKVEAYIRRLSENIKGEVTSSELATLNKAVRMAHTLMEQKVKAIAEREAYNKKRKWENFQGGISSGGGNNNNNRNNNNYNNNHNYNNNRNNNQNQYRNPNRNH